MVLGGQYCVTQLPHQSALGLVPCEYQHLVSMQNFVGMLEYLGTWRWGDSVGIITTAKGFSFSIGALPFLIDDEGRIQKVGEYVAGESVFASDAKAFAYMLALTKRDLQYRGIRDDRLRSFEFKQQANFLLYRKVQACPDAHEYERLRQHWDTVNRRKYREFEWSPEQSEALRLIAEGVSHEDEEAKADSLRWLFLQGCPGAAKPQHYLRLPFVGVSISRFSLYAPSATR